MNSSREESKGKFVCVFKKDRFFSHQDKESMMSKYPHLYLSEQERGTFLKSLVKLNQEDPKDAFTFIKDSTLDYLHDLFDPEKQKRPEMVLQALVGSRDAVESMVDLLDGYNVMGLQDLIAGLSAHDFYTFDHSINVAMYCIMILKTLKPKASRNELVHVGLGGLLHDLGKIKISTQILNNPDGLTDEEYNEIKKHPDFGVELMVTMEDRLKDQGIESTIIRRVIHEHHENYNGTGYPRGLKENEIHFYARICAIADFYDAITTQRSYNKVLSNSRAIEVMLKTSGKKIDPKIFKIFSNTIEHKVFSEITQLEMDDSFDPTLPFRELPLRKPKIVENFGKVRSIDTSEKSEDTKNKIKYGKKEVS